MQYIAALILLFCSLDSFAAALAPLGFDYSRLVSVNVRNFLETRFWDNNGPKYADEFHKRSEVHTRGLAMGALMELGSLTAGEQDEVFGWLQSESSDVAKKGAMEAAFGRIPTGIFKWSDEYKIFEAALGGRYHRVGAIVDDWNKLPLLRKIALLEQHSKGAGYTPAMQDYHLRLKEYAALEDFALLLFRPKYEDNRPSLAGARRPQRLDMQKSLDKAKALGALDEGHLHTSATSMIHEAKDAAVSSFIMTEFEFAREHFILGNDTEMENALSTFLSENFSKRQEDALVSSLLDIYYGAEFSLNALTITASLMRKLDSKVRGMDYSTSTYVDRLEAVSSLILDRLLSPDERSSLEQISKGLVFAVSAAEVLQLTLEGEQFLMGDPLAMAVMRQVDVDQARIQNIRRNYISRKYFLPTRSIGAAPADKLPFGWSWRNGLNGYLDLWCPILTPAPAPALVVPGGGGGGGGAVGPAVVPAPVPAAVPAPVPAAGLVVPPAPAPAAALVPPAAPPPPPAPGEHGYIAPVRYVDALAARKKPPVGGGGVLPPSYSSGSDWMNRTYSSPRDFLKWFHSGGELVPALPRYPSSESVPELGNSLSAIKVKVSSFVDLYDRGSKSSDSVFTEYDSFAALKKQLESFYKTYPASAPRAWAM
ncbi:MAG: hypothetical protein LBJ03_04085 [Holosporales bacterium]|jgi:hypothetical protein|nr:hypothetical protein [Holosporales bacterium]